MPMVSDFIGAGLMILGLVFFTAGTIGLIRFPDVRSQLHALTKADNLGLGLVLLGVAIQAGEVSTAILLLLVWALALGAASVSVQALAGVEARKVTEAPPMGATSASGEGDR